MKSNTHIKELIIRLARLAAAAGWEVDLNPAQRAALSYMSRANRFSRSPSHVADYLGTTRGTTSQSLKSLQQKGYIQEKRSEQDKRVISYDLTQRGQQTVALSSPIEEALAELDVEEIEVFQHSLTRVAQIAVRKNASHEFGVCRSCIHHTQNKNGAFCKLLATELSTEETTQICAEQVSG